MVNKNVAEWITTNDNNPYLNSVLMQYIQYKCS